MATESDMAHLLGMSGVISMILAVYDNEKMNDDELQWYSGRAYLRVIDLCQYGIFTHLENVMIKGYSSGVYALTEKGKKLAETLRLAMKPFVTEKIISIKVE